MINILTPHPAKPLHCTVWNLGGRVARQSCFYFSYLSPTRRWLSAWLWSTYLRWVTANLGNSRFVTFCILQPNTLSFYLTPLIPPVCTVECLPLPPSLSDWQISGVSVSRPGWANMLMPARSNGRKYTEISFNCM